MDFARLFQSVEDAVYEVMVWILLLPKTLFLALFSPRKAIGYVEKEWDKKPDERFDEYLSPVLLWLLVTVIPFSLLIILGGDKLPASFTEGSKAFSDNLLPTTLYAMIVPFTYIAWMEIVNEGSIKRSALRLSFYKHCFALTPGLLITALFLSLAISGIFLTPSIIIGLIALPVYEAFVFQSELKVKPKKSEPKAERENISYIKAFLYAMVPQIVLAVILLIVILSS